MNRTKRKALARMFKSELGLRTIPNATEKSIHELSKKLAYMYQSEKYLGW